MKTVAILFFLLLSGCSSNYTTESFVYQDEQPEKQLNITKIQTELNKANISAVVSAVSLTAEDGITLRGVKLINKDALVNIVFFSANGMKVSMSSKILNKFSLLPANVIWFDYRGMGVSDKKENLSLNSLRTDALKIFDFSKDEFPTNLPITIHGLSMGSLVASYVAVNKKIDALILDGAISTVPELVDNLMPTWSKPFYSVNLSPELAEINNVDFIKEYNKPLLFLIGEDDSTTPVINSKELYNISSSQIKVLAIIPNTEHGETMRKDKAIKAYQDFINKLICCKNG
ncbi:alpha/beta hydrolase [Colwellia sp. MB02u-10]|uniref:alpha/beta hydrolase n=1 Tax=Colwellia sp. MB02u-10 TaxID=2759828 RepID=UPI0015F5CD0C|nr:alpha/beta fold hydrolase [Colwellia sp. MB02u-10]MBA6340960.1 alpha/beta hydrolase [Colwellia sp. MB02u-10]